MAGMNPTAPAARQLARARTAFVFVHGAWHSSAQWAATLRELARLGAAGYAVDLPGHGLDGPLPGGNQLPGQPGLLTEKSPLASGTMDGCAEAVLETLRLTRHHNRVVLVAHSAGGGPAALAARAGAGTRRRPRPPLRLRPRRPPPLPRLRRGARERHLPRPLSPSRRLRRTRRRTDNPLSPDPAYVEALRLTYHQDTPPDRFARWRAALGTDVPLAVPSTPVTLTAARWGSIPRTFLRCADDQALIPAVQDLMIAETDRAVLARPFTVRTLPGGHSPFAARPAELAAAPLA
ncbi:alpha/beta fold hydrolase [Streptomyces koyangensis]|uniref:alpha/beta fold hydrolase n=1 Tax=Streptomyces koyangensis TaxID=188770 RepID=UPI00339B2C77